MRLRAHDHYTSSTLIGGKGGAGPSSLHTTLEGLTEYMCKCKMDVKSTRILSYMTLNGSCFMVTWTTFKNHLLEVGLTQKPGDHDTPNAHNHWFILLYHVWTHVNRNSLKQHLVEDPVTYDFTLHLRVRDHTT